MDDDLWVSTSQQYLAPRRVDPWAEEAAAVGGVGEQRLLSVAEEASSLEVATALGLQPGEQVIVRRRLMLLDGKPVESTDSYYPFTVATGTPLAEFRKIPGGAISQLDRLGYTPHDVREEITAHRPTAAERQALDLAEGDPVMVLTRLTIASDGIPFEYSVMTMVAAGRRLRYRLSAG